MTYKKTYKKDDIIIRFSNVAAQPSSKEGNVDDIPIKRLVGFVAAQNLFPLFDNAGLAANPRSSRRNSVVDDIINTLDTTPELFRFKSKGILLGTAHYDELQRNRYRLRFDDPTIEGILDGGHNMLAIGLFVLREIMEDREWKKIRSWDDMKAQWDDRRPQIEKLKSDFDFLVPVELLVPTGFEEDDAEAFMMPLLEVCEARNNNAQLPQEAKSNKQGFYDAIKDSVSPDFSARVEWKPNSWEDESEKRPIKIRDLIALAWIPLNALNDDGALPANISVSPQNTYRNKAECSKRFEELMSSDAVTKKRQGSQRELSHAGVLSAFKILADLPALYDQIYADFPKAYNGDQKRRFAANPIVKIYDPEKRKAALSSGKDVHGYTSVQPKTPFHRYNVSNNYPEGLIVPLIYGLKGLLVVKDGEVIWAVKDPKSFVKKHLSKIAESYQLVMNMAKWDPQKISKDPSSYEFSVREFRNALFEEQRAQKRGDV
jgi:hypothetical protein